eukprot:COSAG02_NODE_4851_length_4902_cov_14.437643_2_plen_80_part_00
MQDQFTKTGSGQTWGKLKGKLTKKLKTRANAFSPQGDFICEYVGEILAVEEAMARPDHSYQFELGITSKLLGAKNGLFF